MMTHIGCGQVESVRAKVETPKFVQKDLSFHACQALKVGVESLFDSTSYD
jgi:hypothetical protein